MALAKRIIPCLDVDNGRVVKGVQFVDIRDAGDPVEIAKRYDEQGADEITFLDITASSDDRETMVHVVEEVAAQVFIPLTVGGGIRKVEDIRRMLNAGADGYLPKRAAASELISAVRTVHTGSRYVHESLIGALVNGYLSRPEESKSRSLTKRQLQVLALVARGLTNQMVAEELGLSTRTVDRHLENMMLRLEMNSRVELVSHALQEGLIELKD